jgi:hypothetical protein
LAPTQQKENRVKTVIQSFLLASVAVFTMTTLVNAAPPVRVFTALLNGAQEANAEGPNPTPSEALGNALLTFDEATSELCLHLSFNASLLSAPVAAAHIHGPAEPGVAAGILFPIDTTNPVNTCATLNKQQEKDLKKGLLYINIHTSNGDGGGFPAGEIRGQILPNNDVKY